MTKPEMVTLAVKFGVVDTYMLARLAPEPSHLVTCSAAFDDYRSWCVREGLAPLREALFTDQMMSIARAAGIGLRQRGGNLSFLDTALRDMAPLSTAADSPQAANTR